MSKNKILIILGSTASGKSDLAVKIAKDRNGEIISADSRQVYKYLNIGSGKITKEEMQNINHYGIDITSPKYNNEKYNNTEYNDDYKLFTAGDWLSYTENKITEIINKNKLPIICGGTGMYIDALLYGLENNPGPDYELREKMKNKSLLEIQELLKNKNPNYFSSLNNSEKNNKNRLIRKLELENVIYKKRELKYDIEMIIINKDLKELKEKITQRLDKRLENDLLINEVKDLIYNKNIDINWLISLGLEYKYVTEYILQKINYQEMKDELISKIFQYAKRQITWNKKYKDLAKDNQ